MITLDQNYHKKGEDLDSKTRWKLLDKQQSEKHESIKYAKSDIIIGPG